MASSQDAWYLSLLGLAENFRTSNPPSIKSCIQCLQAVFYFKPPSRVEARTHLQLGNILLTHTKNIDLARSHLERAWTLSQTINQFDDVKFEAASVLAELYEQQQQTSLSQAILRTAVEFSQHNVYWHCRLIFQLAQIHASQKDLNAAGGLLAVGAEYSQISSANYTSVLFTLSRCMLFLIEKKYNEALPLLNTAGQQIENWQGNQYQKEYLKIFYLVLQICHLTMLGQVKIVKQVYLKQFQQSIQMTMSLAWPTDDVVTGPLIGDMFLWMPKEHLHLISYLISTMNSMQNGYMEKAKKYSDTAFTMIENLKLQENKPILSVFQLMLLENLVMCQIVMGNRSVALSKIAQATELCRHQPKLFQSHKAQLHFLLGLYAMSMDRLEAAEAQLLSALNMGPEKELEIFINLNLAIVYIRLKREESLSRLMERIDPESLSSNTLKAAAYFVQGLRAFLGPRSTDAKKYLRETLKISNPEDLARLTSGSLVLLGHIFLSLNNHKESMNVIAPALQIASKIPDVHIQVWATALLKDLSRICGDRNRENEAYTMHVGHSEALLKDQYQSSRMEEHALIEWIDGPIPNITRNNALASTSQPML